MLLQSKLERFQVRTATLFLRPPARCCTTPASFRYPSLCISCSANVPMPHPHAGTQPGRCQSNWKRLWVPATPQEKA